MQKEKIFGIPIDNISMAEALEMTKEMLEKGNPRTERAEQSSYDGKQHKIFTLNPEILLLGRKNQDYKKVLQSADLALPDGIGLVWLGRIFGMRFKKRVAGTDFMEKLAELAGQTGKSIFLLGGRNGAAEKTANALKTKFPNLKISGYLEDQNQWQNCAEIFKADILFVALGAPKQEVWIYDNLPKLQNIKIAVGVGGAFDFISGKIPRAPKLLREIGLEWMWRLMMEPRKRFWRVFNAVIIFPVKVFMEKISHGN